MVEIKKTLLSISFVLVSLFVVDQVAGVFYRHLYNGLSGFDREISKAKYAMEHADEDIIFLGSSRCSHHYDMSLVADAFPGKTVINLGRDGVDFAYVHCLINSIVMRDTTQTHQFVVDMNHYSLSSSAYYNIKVLDHWYYSDDNVCRFIKQNEENASMKYLSNLYKYNGDALELLKTIFFKTECSILRGYSPIAESADIPEYENWKDRQVRPVDETAARLMEDAIALCKRYNSQILFLLSPILHETSERLCPSILRMKEICADNQIPCLNYSNDKYFMDHPEYFKDVMHLNRKGAEVYTKQIINWLLKDESTASCL